MVDVGHGAALGGDVAHVHLLGLNLDLQVGGRRWGQALMTNHCITTSFCTLYMCVRVSFWIFFATFPGFLTHISAAGRVLDLVQ